MSQRAEETGEPQTAVIGAATLAALGAGRPMGARLATMMSTTRLGTVTLADLLANRRDHEVWMLRQPNCGRKTLNELRALTDEIVSRLPDGILDELTAAETFNAGEVTATTTVEDEISLPDLLAADALSVRLGKLLTLEPLRSTTLRDYRADRTGIEAVMTRQPNCGRKTTRELRDRIDAHMRHRTSLPNQQSDAATIFEAVPDPELAGPPHDLDLGGLVAWHLERLPERTALVLTRRFGLRDNPPETLHEIGEDLRVTRERIRQIEAKGLKRIRTLAARHPLAAPLDRIRGTALAGVFAMTGHATREDIERAARRLPGEAGLALAVADADPVEWLTHPLQAHGRGWLGPRLDRVNVACAERRLRDRLGGTPLPRAVTKLLGDVAELDVRAAAELGLGLHIVDGYAFQRRPGRRGRRAVALHRMLSGVGRPLRTVELLRRHTAEHPDDSCTDREVAIVLEAAPHLFVDVEEGCWAAIGPAPEAPTTRRAVLGTASASSEMEAGEDETVAAALERALAQRGPTRIGTLIDDAADIVPPGRSPHSVGPTLLSNPSRFTRVLPGVYALADRVPDDLDLARAINPEYLLNAIQARVHALARRAGEPWGAYPLWTPTAEMRLCRWTRRQGEVRILRSLLAVATIDEWPTDEDDRSAWRRLAARDGRFELHSPASGSRPPPEPDRVLAAALRLSERGSIGFVTVNRILHQNVLSHAAADLLDGMRRAGMAAAPDDCNAWQLPHAPGHSLDGLTTLLADRLHATGDLDWADAELARIAPFFAGRTDGPSLAGRPADPPDELDDLETLIAEHRRAARARRLEDLLEGTDA